MIILVCWYAGLPLVDASVLDSILSSAKANSPLQAHPEYTERCMKAMHVVESLVPLMESQVPHRSDVVAMGALKARHIHAREPGALKVHVDGLPSIS